MRVTNLIPSVQYQMQQSQQAVATALQQLSTGLRVNQLSDDPAASAGMVRSLADSATVDQFTSNVSALLAKMQTADSALSGMVTSLNSAITAGVQGANDTVSAQERQGIAADVQGILSSIVSQANTSYQGKYLFAGSESTSVPFVAASATYVSQQGSASSPLTASTPLTAGSVTKISDAATGQSLIFKAAAGDTIATLQQAVANAASAGTLSGGTSTSFDAAGHLEISSSTGIVVNSNDAALGAMTEAPGTAVANAYAYVGNATTNAVQIGTSTNVNANLPGSALVSANVLGALSGLISALTTGTSSQIHQAVTGVSDALGSLGQQRVPFDNTISQLNSQDSYLGKEKVTLSTLQKSLTGIDLAEAATNLSQAQLQNNAVMAAAAKSITQTLLDYLK